MVASTESTVAFPPPLDSLPQSDLDILQRHVSTVEYAAGDLIFEQGSPGDACYIVDSGVVRIDLEGDQFHTHSEVDSDRTLAYVEAGSLLGELALLDGLPRSASAYAQTKVTARRVGLSDLEVMKRRHARIVDAVYVVLGRAAALKLRDTNQRLAHAIFHDDPDPQVDLMVARAVEAQRDFKDWPEERIDALLHDMAHAIADRAEELARANVEETGLGNVQSKIVKNTVASLGMYRSMVGKPGSGPMRTDADSMVTEIANPAGVVFGLIPVTNPVSTTVFKSLIAIKGRNALIISPNRNAAKVTARAADLIRDVLQAHGAPVDLIQVVRTRVSRKITAQFMTHPDVNLILATGGASMVKAAYSSGTPAIGVGPGNTPAFVAADADIPAAVAAILMSKSFDNGMPCGSEHNLVVVASVREAFVRELERQGAAVLSPDEASRFTGWVVDPATRKFRGDIVGQPAEKIAREADIERPYDIRLIVVPAEGLVPDNPYAREKMTPVLSLFTVETEEEGLDACGTLLLIDGTGHTASIHTQNAGLAARFGALMPASRILVNTPSVHGMLGITTGLNLTATLGCGTFGGTSTTDNVTYTHLLNVKRLAHFLPSAAAAWEEFL